MIEVRAAGILLENDHILLATHVKENQRYRVLPGGRVEEGETLLAALEREILEESGLKVTIGKLLFFHEIILPRRHILNFYFLMSKNSGHLLKIEEEVLKGVEFFPVADLKNIDFRPALLRPALLKGLAGKFRDCPQFLI